MCARAVEKVAQQQQKNRITFCRAAKPQKLSHDCSFSLSYRCTAELQKTGKFFEKKNFCIIINKNVLIEAPYDMNRDPINQNRDVMAQTYSDATHTYTLKIVQSELCRHRVRMNRKFVSQPASQQQSSTHTRFSLKIFRHQFFQCLSL